MAEQTQTIRSKGLLITALAVGVIAVVLYNVQLYQVRKSYEKPTVRLLKVNRDVGPSRRLSEEDLETVEIDKSLQQSLGNVLLAREADYATSKVLRKSLQKGEWLTWAHFDADRASSPSAILSSTNHTTFTLSLDPDNTPGDILRIGDLVDVWADVFMPGANGRTQLKTKRVLEAARVVSVGDQGPESAREAASQTRSERTPQRYRKITIEILRGERPILHAIRTHIPRGLWQVSLLRPDVPLPDKRGTVNDPELRKLDVRPVISDRPGDL